MIGKAFSDANKIKKQALKMSLARIGDEDERVVYDRWINNGIKTCISDINLVCDLMEGPYGDAMHRLASIIKDRQTSIGRITNNPQNYLITIRPSNNVQLTDFVAMIQHMILRKCFVKGVYSFEQKGTSPSTLGDGVHCHIVATMKQCSKAAVLRDISSTFKSWINNGNITANNIDVRTTHNPEEVVKNYLIEYRSDDGHKEPTKYWDEQWRRESGMDSLYVFDNGGSVTSDGHMSNNN